jgi:hypothetical protein
VVDGDTEDVRREDVRSSDHEKRISKNCETLVEVIKIAPTPSFGRSPWPHSLSLGTTQRSR